MIAIERDNPRLKGILAKDYARPAIDKNRLGELIDLIGKHLTAAKALIPPRPLLEAMTKQISRLIEVIITNRIQSRALAADSRRIAAEAAQWQNAIARMI